MLSVQTITISGNEIGLSSYSPSACGDSDLGGRRSPGELWSTTRFHQTGSGECRRIIRQCSHSTIPVKLLSLREGLARRDPPLHTADRITAQNSVVMSAPAELRA